MLELLNNGVFQDAVADAVYKRHLGIVVFNGTVKHFLEIIDLNPENIVARHSEDIVNQLANMKVDYRVAWLCLVFVDFCSFFYDVFICLWLHHTVFHQFGVIGLRSFQSGGG